MERDSLPAASPFWGMMITTQLYLGSAIADLEPALAITLFKGKGSNVRKPAFGNDVQLHSGLLV